MIIEIRKRDEKKVRRFRSKGMCGAWLRKQGWPKGLVYAPDADRVGLAQCMQGSPWVVKINYEP